MTPVRIDHVAVVVENLEPALHFWEKALGLRCTGIEEIESEGVQAAFLDVAGSHIELIKPLSDDSGVAKYLAKRGQGMHHLCLGVEDIDAMMAQLREAGVEMINDVPRLRDNGTRYAFVHPKSTGGVLVELYQSPH